MYRTADKCGGEKKQYRISELGFKRKGVNNSKAANIHNITQQHRKAMDSFSSSSRGSSQQLSAQDLKNQLKSQLALEYAQQFLETVGRKCFEKCVTKPGSSLSGGESSCISRCVDRYIEATGIISKALFSGSQ